jgi:hypothetical protein
MADPAPEIVERLISLAAAMRQRQPLYPSRMGSAYCL